MERPPREYKINKDSNYRKYYLNDRDFHKMVISKEKGPFQFKIHAFRNDENREPLPYSRDEELHFMQICDEFKALNHKSNIHDGKLKIMFEIELNEDAIKCYDYFHKIRRGELG